MIQMINRKEIPVVPARGETEVALDLMIRPFYTFFIYRTCVGRAPCARAVCELVVLLLPENVTGVRPRWHATSSEHFLHTSHCTLHTMHFTLHTCTSHSTVHLISKHLISLRLMSPHLTSSHLIPSLLTCHLSKFFSTVFISSEH